MTRTTRPVLWLGMRGLRDLILRVCAEVNVGPQAFAVLERFVDNPVATGIGAVLGCFADVRRQRAQ